ncbi:hypothetical protein [Belnapia rosea]|uniref:hypothetical protein n=1 Tax=Belnapia rosea TaxID=938405 RepID=UPI00088CA292|nr:hypothetical protein [Belnapia rosea]SDB74758.1 hypothetical protein SAMN02927895_05460 [Belnapia rosea]
MSLRGSVDRLSVDGSSGWIFDSIHGEPLMIQALYNGRIIGEALADRHRADLAAAGFGDGRCGYEMNFSEPVDPIILPFVAIKPQGGDVELPRTNFTSFADYFRTLHDRQPAAGRHRSVFGGLWTDRTDAQRVLQGRVASGATPADLATALGSLVLDGHMMMKSVLAPVGFGPGELAAVNLLEADLPLDPQTDPNARRLLEAIPGLIFRDTALRAMRAVLDDNPLAYRVALSRRQVGEFAQPSAMERLTSPAECVALVACAGNAPVLVDLIRDSHRLPEFTVAGQSRWVSAEASAGIELAVGHALSVEQVEVGPMDLLMVSPGTLYRLRTPEGSAAVTTLCCPARVSPINFVAGRGGTLALRHFSGAMLMV